MILYGSGRLAIVRYYVLLVSNFLDGVLMCSLCVPYAVLVFL